MESQGRNDSRWFIFHPFFVLETQSFDINVAKFQIINIFYFLDQTSGYTLY
jgi:hypothetical protein